MKTFVSYNTKGVITQTSTGLVAPVVDGLLTIEVASDVTLGDWWVSGGEATAYTAEQVTARNNRPTRVSIWNNSSMLWDTPLDFFKEKAWGTIKEERILRMAGTFTHDSHVYKIDPVGMSSATIDARESLIAGEPFAQMWVLADNTVVTLNAAEMIAVGRACKAVVSELWATSQYLRGLIESATTIAEVDSVAW